MKALLSLAVLLLASSVQAQQVLIVIPRTVAEANPGKVKTLFERLWENGQNPHPASNWKLIEKVSNTNLQAIAYDVTEAQIRKAFDAAEIARLKAILDDANILWLRCSDWRSEVTNRGWRLVAEKGGMP